MLKQNKAPIIIAAAILVLFLLDKFSLGHNIIHGVIDIFAGGRSSIKEALFFIWLILLSLLSLKPLQNSLDKFKIENKWLILSIFLPFLYGLFLLVWFLNKYRFKLTDFVISFHNQEISSTVLVHNHLMKGFNGLISNLFGKAVEENVDTGWAYVHLLPTWAYIIGGVLFVIALVCLIIKFTQLRKNYLSSTGKEILFTFTYGITSFSLLKNILDGGIFNRETPITLTVFLFLIAPEKKSWWIYLPIVLFLVYFYFPGMFFESLILIGALIMGLLTMCYWLTYWQKPNKKRLGILLIVLTATFLYAPMANQINAFINSQDQLEAGAYIGLFNQPQTGNLKQLDKIEGLGIYSVPEDNEKISDIIKENKLLSNLGPIAVPWLNCIPTNPYEKYSFEMVSPTQLSFDTNLEKTHQIAKITKVETEGTGTNNLFRYKIGIIAHPCTPRILNVVDELIQEQGAHTYFILNFNKIDDRDF